MYNPKMQCTEIVQYNDSMKFRETPHRHYANKLYSTIMEKPTHNILQKMSVLYNPGKQNNILNKHYSIILCQGTKCKHYTENAVF